MYVVQMKKNGYCLVCRIGYTIFITRTCDSSSRFDTRKVKRRFQFIKWNQGRTAGVMP